MVIPFGWIVCVLFNKHMVYLSWIGAWEQLIFVNVMWCRLYSFSLFLFSKWVRGAKFINNNYLIDLKYLSNFSRAMKSQLHKKTRLCRGGQHD